MTKKTRYFMVGAVAILAVGYVLPLVYLIWSLRNGRIASSFAVS